MSAALPSLVSAICDAMATRDVHHVEASTYEELVHLLYEARFDGSVTLHFQGGKPQGVEFRKVLSWKLN